MLTKRRSGSLVITALNKVSYALALMITTQLRRDRESYIYQKEKRNE